MKVAEQDIEQAILAIENASSGPKERFEHHSERFPTLTAFLFSEDMDILNEEEQALFLFIGDVLFTTWAFIEREDPTCSIEDVEDILDEIWERWEKAKTINDKMDTLFEYEEEEELLAFVEDMILDNDELSLAAKMAIAVNCATIIKGLQMSD